MLSKLFLQGFNGVPRKALTFLLFHVLKSSQHIGSPLIRPARFLILHAYSP
jgi:hypothetical protein